MCFANRWYEVLFIFSFPNVTFLQLVIFPGEKKGRECITFLSQQIRNIFSVVERSEDIRQIFACKFGLIKRFSSEC
jgi:hypothetical protein